MKNNKEQRELLKEIIGRLKEMQSKARQEAAESDSLIRWGRQTMIDEVLMMLYTMHDEMVDRMLMEETPAKETELPFVNTSSIKNILSQPISFLANKMTHRAYGILVSRCDIVADVYGIGKPIAWLRGCGRATHKEIIAGLESVHLPDPGEEFTLNPVDYGFCICKINADGQKWYKLEE